MSVLIQVQCLRVSQCAALTLVPCRDELNGRVIWSDATTYPHPTPVADVQLQEQTEEPVRPSGEADGDRGGLRDIPLADLIQEAERLETSLLSRIQVRLPRLLRPAYAETVFDVQTLRHPLFG